MWQLFCWTYGEIVDEMKRELAEIVRRGRSTGGPQLENDGEAVWDTDAWLNDSY